MLLTTCIVSTNLCRSAHKTVGSHHHLCSLGSYVFHSTHPGDWGARLRLDTRSFSFPLGLTILRLDLPVTPFTYSLAAITP